MPGIEGINPLGTSRTQQGAGAHQVANDGGAHGRGESVSDAARGRDALIVSNRGRIVAEAAKVVATTPDVRAEKVAALKAAIANGSYSVDAQAIAGRLLSAGIADE